MPGARVAARPGEAYSSPPARTLRWRCQVLGRLVLERVGEAPIRVARRFPAVTVVVLTAAVAAQWMVAGSAGAAVRILVASTFAVPALTATALARETRVGNRGLLALDTLVVAVAVAFAWMWPAWSEAVGITRLVQANLAGLLAVAVLPFLVRDGRAMFWPFNRTLFVRFVVASIFAGVLFAGLALAIAALQTLFDLSLPDEIYAHLLFLLLTVFHPLYVLSGIPAPLRALADDDDLPAVIRVFAQFVLLPLVCVYLAILLAYLARVLISQEWPQGWIGWMVSAVAVAGQLAVLLLDPLTRTHRGGWVRRAARIYYAAMIPSLVMLLVAIWLRVAQYGITENRYFLAALAIWMLLLCIGRTVGAWRDPRWIPASLAVVVLLTSAGPWSAYAVSQASQAARLERLLDDAGRLENGVAVAGTGTVDVATVEEVVSVVRHLVGTYGPHAVDPWFGGDVSAGIDTARSPHPHSEAADRIVRRALQRIGLDGTEVLKARNAVSVTLRAADATWSFPIEDATHVAAFVLRMPQPQEITLAGDALVLTVVGGRLVATRREAVADTAFVASLEGAFDRAKPRSPTAAKGPSGEDVVVLAVIGPDWTGKVVVESIHAWVEGDSRRVESMAGTLLLRRR